MQLVHVQKFNGRQENIEGTADLTLKYEKSKADVLMGYSDADWAGDQDNRHSTSGNLFLMAGGAVSWMSKKQSMVALSTAESEYVALSVATQEAVWMRRLLTDLGVCQKVPTALMEDNQARILCHMLGRSILTSNFTMYVKL